MSEKQTTQTLLGITSEYLRLLSQTQKRNETIEFEIRFGTLYGMKQITRINSDAVIKRLLSGGFNISEKQTYLRISSEFTDEKTGVVKMSRMRAELSGIGDISEYCRSNDIDRFHKKSAVTFINKMPAKNGEHNVELYNAFDYNFRAALSVEQDVTNSKMAQSTIASWKDNKKTFRYITRHRLLHDEMPVAIDISIVKESYKKGKYMVPTYNFDEARITQAQEIYEIEVEILNNKIGIATEYNTPEALEKQIRKTIMLILSGLQGTNYPISYSKQNDILSEYMTTLWGKEYNNKMRVKPKNFVGPSSYTLQLKNILPTNSDAIYTNIRENYTVTDKADGERKLMFVARDGKIYLIDTNMNVQFTGSKTTNKELINTIIDGEHILHDKQKRFINLYAAFDLYYLAGKDIRAAPFIPLEGKDSNTARYPLLSRIVEDLEISGLNNGTISPMRFSVKSFYQSNASNSIFNACDYLLNRVETLEYETDGLIFTPSYYGVGGNKIGETTKPYKRSWEHSFKWKPVEQNTIDFLVTIKRGVDGREEIKSMFQSGTDVNLISQITQYKTAILRVGFNEEKHGYINPLQNIIDDEIPKFIEDDDDEDNKRKPMQFFPTSPSDINAGVCNLLLENAQAGEKVMFTEERQAIEDNMIVEFRYDINKPEGWRWIPLRVRYDKTAEFRAGEPNYGNEFHVADSNWYTIHNPITKEMITTGSNIPDEIRDDDVYYNNSSRDTNTQALRDFHNLYIKYKLIKSVSKKGDTLIDLSVGKGGDIPKWISSKLKFVFGIDISRDNIENRRNGVCARYLNYRKQFKIVPDALFVTGDSSVNIRSTDAIINDKNKQITRAVFGEGPKDASQLGKGVYKNYGIGREGFDICSMQFSLHYMFENLKTFHNLLRNVSETTKVGGYFIGTCFDGQQVFSMLRGKNINESIEIIEEDKKLFEITKRYSSKSFNDDMSSLGYAIDVYQDSINKTFREYLVNFAFLDQMMENYGFTRLTHEQLKSLNLPSSYSFREFYSEMRRDIDRYRYSESEYGEALNMTYGQQIISFLNRYFIYVKSHAVDAKTIATQFINQSSVEELLEEKETMAAEEVIEETKKQPVVKRTRKLKKRLVLKE